MVFQKALRFAIVIGQVRAHSHFQILQAAVLAVTKRGGHRVYPHGEWRLVLYRWQRCRQYIDTQFKSAGRAAVPRLTNSRDSLQQFIDVGFTVNRPSVQR